MGRKNYWVVWLINLDSSVSRGGGRVIPRSLAVDNPTFEEVSRALDSLGLKYEAHPEKRHPRHWFEEGKAGCFYVYKVEGLNRRRLIRRLAQVVRSLRRGG